MANIKDIIFNIYSKTSGTLRSVLFKPILIFNNTVRSINFIPILATRFFSVSIDVLDTVVRSVGNVVKINVLDAAKLYRIGISVLDNVVNYTVRVSVLGTPIYSTYKVFISVMESVATDYTVKVTVYNKEDCTDEFIELNC